MVSVFHRVIRGWREKGGFTILELLAVFAILAVIAALVAPRYTGVVAESKVKGCESNIEMLTKAAEMYYEVNKDTKEPPTVELLLDAGYINDYVYCPVGVNDDKEDYEWNDGDKRFICIDQQHN